MPNPAHRAVALAALTAAIVAAAVALDLPSAAAQSDDEQAGRIVARRLDDGRTEFGWQPAGAARILPSARYFPPNVPVGRWLNSSPVEVEGVAIGRINARMLADGRIEFAFTPTDGERIEPPARYFPVDAGVGRWLRSTEIAIGAAPATGFVAVSAGYRHTCAIRESGEIECWGDNDYGQSTPPAGSFTAVSANASHSCAIRDTGEIECWGSNRDGQTDAPAGRFSTVSVGFRHSCGLRTTGEIECWGSNVAWFDQDADTGEEVAILGGQANAPSGRFVTVSAAGVRTCGLRMTGEIECWGDNGVRQNDAPPGRFIALSAGNEYACAIREDGEIECWGWNVSGETDAPPGRFTAVSAGPGHHACAIRESGAIECWGENTSGEINVPTGSFTAVAAGGGHICAIRESGAIECWGSNDVGQTNAPAR